MMKFSKMLKYGSIFVVTMMVCFWGGICVGGLLKGISLQELFAEKGTKMVEYAGIMLVGVVLIFRWCYCRSPPTNLVISFLDGFPAMGSCRLGCSIGCSYATTGAGE